MKKLLAVLALALVGCPGMGHLSDSDIEEIMGTPRTWNNGSRYQRFNGGWVDTHTAAPYRQGSYIPR